MRMLYVRMGYCGMHVKILFFYYDFCHTITYSSTAIESLSCNHINGRDSQSGGLLWSRDD